MPPVVALILCMILVTVLLLVERKRNQDASFALWIPTLWMLLCGSKPIGRWLGTDVILASSRSMEEGSSLDRLALGILIVLALLVLSRRKIDWFYVKKDNRWLIILYLFLGLSILWSDFQYVSLKRWIRLSAVTLIGLLILSERSPLQALESVFRRCAYVLIPVSLLLIKYFPGFGIEYVSWSGMKMWVGVTMQKNSLGVLCGLSAFLIIWTYNRQWRTGNFFKNKMQALADALVLFLALYLLKGFNGAYSATVVGFLIVGIASLFFLYRTKNYSKHIATFIVVVVTVGLLSLSISDSFVSVVTPIFERNESFTGRTEIWQAVRDVATQSPLLGVGYGGYWGLQDTLIYSTLGVREAHSGYLEVYLDVGIAGIILLLAFLLSYYLKTLRFFENDYDWALFGICFLIMTLIENFTESHFLRTSSYLWNSMVLITIVFSSRDEDINRPVVPGIELLRNANPESYFIEI